MKFCWIKNSRIIFINKSLLFTFIFILNSWMSTTKSLRNQAHNCPFCSNPNYEPMQVHTLTQNSWQFKLPIIVVQLNIINKDNQFFFLHSEPVEPRLNSNRVLQGPFGGDALNKKIFIPRAQTRDFQLKVKHSHHCITIIILIIY